jgi:hypothetical protein
MAASPRRRLYRRPSPRPSGFSSQEVLRAGSREGGAGRQSEPAKGRQEVKSRTLRAVECAFHRSKRPLFQERRRPWASRFLAVNGPLRGVRILTMAAYQIEPRGSALRLNWANPTPMALGVRPYCEVGPVYDSCELGG